MTDHTNAELIAEAQKLLFSDSAFGYEDTKEGDLISRLADALEAADRRADQAEATAEHLHDEDSREIVALTQERDDLAAVVEKVRFVIERESGWFRYRAEQVSTVLATAPSDALREVKADAWASGYRSGYSDRGAPGDPFTRNPYREEQDRG